MNGDKGRAGPHQTDRIQEGLTCGSGEEGEEKNWMEA